MNHIPTGLFARFFSPVNLFPCVAHLLQLRQCYFVFNVSFLSYFVIPYLSYSPSEGSSLFFLFLGQISLLGGFVFIFLDGWKPCPVPFWVISFWTVGVYYDIFSSFLG